LDACRTIHRARRRLLIVLLHFLLLHLTPFGRMDPFHLGRGAFGRLKLGLLLLQGSLQLSHPAVIRMLHLQRLLPRRVQIALRGCKLLLELLFLSPQCLEFACEVRDGCRPVSCHDFHLSGGVDKIFYRQHQRGYLALFVFQVHSFAGFQSKRGLRRFVACLNADLPQS